MITETIPQIKQLSASEKLLLIEERWEELVAHPDQVPLSKAQRKELDRRYAEYKKNPDDGSPWPEVKKRLLKSL